MAFHTLVADPWGKVQSPSQNFWGGPRRPGFSSQTIETL
jgi:hypothetical protein